MTEPGATRSEPVDWDGYYRYTAGRSLRPLFAKGMAAVAAAGVGSGHAIEIGFGDGMESAALLHDGWSVTAIDPTPGAADLLLARVPPEDRERLKIITSDAEGADLPEFDLLYAGYALPFVAPAQFARVWASIRSRMRPGAFLVANVFGIHDTWANDPAMTFFDRKEALALLDGLEIIDFDEQENDGPSGSGPKHWHLFDLVARRQT